LSKKYLSTVVVGKSLPGS